MLIYAGLGVAGLPWFNGWQGGMSHLAGPTGGYIIGFILAAFFVGHFTDKYIKARRFPALLGLMMTANILLIYIPGLIQLYVWLTFVKGSTVSILQVMNMGAFPFIAGDAVKAVAATAAAWAVLPKQAFRKEVD
jgi:biotin transport system substrate-specific component